MSSRFTCALVLGVAYLAAPSAVSAQDWKAALKDSLAAVMPLSRLSADGKGITAHGATVIIKASGISGGLFSDDMPRSNIISDGKVHQLGGLGGMINSGSADRTVKAGERFLTWHHFQVDDNDVILLLVSEDATPDPAHGTARTKAGLVFQFSKGTLRTLPFQEVMQTIEGAITVEGREAQPKTVSLGQTTTEVEKALGKPDKIVTLGEKVIYVYKDLKVVFINGKVTDVQ